MQKSKIPTLTSTKPSVSSAHTHENKPAILAKGRVLQKKIKGEDEKQSLKKEENKNSTRPRHAEDKVSKVTIEKSVPDSRSKIKDVNKSTLQKNRTINPTGAVTKGKVGGKHTVTAKTEINKIKSSQDSCANVQSIEKGRKDTSSKENKILHNKAINKQTCVNSITSDKKEETQHNVKIEPKVTTTHPSQSNIEFVADERFRNMILSGKEISPGILKHPSMKTSLYERPSLYRSSLYQPPLDPHKAALKALENMSLEDRRPSVIKKTEPLNWMSPFIDRRLNPFHRHTPINAHSEVMRKLNESMLKQKAKSAKKVTFNIPNSGSKPAAPEKDSVKFRLSVISDRSDGSSDLSTPELSGTVLSRPKKIPSDASHEAQASESDKTAETSSSKEKLQVSDQGELAHIKDVPHENLNGQSVQLNVSQKEPSVTCKKVDDQRYESLSSNCPFGGNFVQLRSVNGPESEETNHSINNAMTMSTDKNAFLNECSETKKQKFLQSQNFLLYANAEFNGLRTSISSPDLINFSYSDAAEVKNMEGPLPNKSGSYYGPGVNDLRTSMSSPELRNSCYKEPGMLNSVLDGSVMYTSIQGSVYSTNKNVVDSGRENTAKPLLCTPLPVSFNQQSKLAARLSPDILSQRTSDYISNAPINMPLVMKSLSKSYYDLSPVCQKLEFENELKGNDDSKEISQTAYFQSILTRQHIMDSLADQECCIVLSSMISSDFCIRHIPNPIAKTLEYGDEMHFVPVELQ